jgi:hypothetical protein
MVDGLIPAADGLVPVGVFEVVRFTELGNSGGSALVSMVEPADLGNRDDPTQLRRFNGSAVWSIFPKRKMTPRTVIVVEKEDYPQEPVRCLKPESSALCPSENPQLVPESEGFQV